MSEEEDDDRDLDDFIVPDDEVEISDEYGQEELNKFHENIRKRL